MLAKVRGVLSIDWSKTVQSQAKVRNAIKDVLDEGLPDSYTRDIFSVKADVMFQHVYERYGVAA
jgi:type I restriction enzyme R subunit